MSETSERALDVFLDLCDLEPEARRARLAELARDDAALASEVERLLAADGRRHGLLDGGLPLARLAELLAAGAGIDSEAPLPESIGPFRIVHLIGEGGMGVVFEAEQEYPKRRVALKVLRASLGSGERSARFRREIEVLARLEHPGIARIQDAGVTPDGLAYFTMELVRGRPLGDHVAAARPPLAQRIDLVARLCDAVEHAHARGVVHRDLKPGNVLVDQDGAPRVLDFGVASATSIDGVDTTMHTEAGVLMGTIGYMSPEQASADGRRIDGRSDVYSIGVMLYEVLGGAPPLSLRGRPLHDAVRAISVEEPPPLSTLDRKLAGDLETVVQKALEKEPDQRYASAAALAADLRRVLAHEPILARPATAFYRLRKLAHRHRALVLGVAAAFATLLIGTAAALWQAQRATRNGREAELQTKVAEHHSYLASTQGAEAALGIGDVETARRLLESAPGTRRGWEWQYLSARLDTSSAALVLEHDVLAAAFAGEPLGDEVLVLDASGALSRWSNDLAQRLDAVELAGAPFTHAAFADDLSALATATAAGDVGLWNLDGSAKDLEVVVRRLVRLAVAPGGAAIAALGNSHNRLLHASLGARDATALGPNGMHAVAFDGTPARVFAGSHLGELLLFDPAVGELSTIHRGDPADLSSIARSADGRRIALGQIDRRVAVLERDDGSLLGPFVGNLGTLTAVALSADGRVLATAGGDGLVRAWDLASGASPHVLAGHVGPVRSVRVSPDGSALLSHGDDRTVRLWHRLADPRSRVLSGHRAWVYPVCFSADGTRLYSGAWDGDLREWDGRDGADRGVLAHLADEGAVLSLASSPDGAWLAAGAFRAGVSLLDARTGEAVGKLPSGSPRSAEALAFDAKSERLATFAFDGHQSPVHGRVEVFDLATRERLRSWRIPSLGFGGLAFHPPSGRLLAATTSRVFAFDVDTGKELVRLLCEPGAAALAIAPDGEEVATGHASGAVILRDPTTLEPFAELRGHHGHVYALCYTPDGTRLLSGARDGQILVWDRLTRTRLATLAGHTNYVYSLAFSPDGSRLASGSGDGTVRLWDTLPRRSR